MASSTAATTELSRPCSSAACARAAMKGGGAAALVDSAAFEIVLVRAATAFRGAASFSSSSMDNSVMVSVIL